MRAFKHALFGTPSADETRRQRSRARSKSHPAPINNPSRSTRESRRSQDLNRHDQRTLDRDGRQISDRNAILGSSPAKKPGILLTPGTGGKGGKSVSFGGAANAKRSHADDLQAEGIRTSEAEAHRSSIPEIHQDNRQQARLERRQRPHDVDDIRGEEENSGQDSDEVTLDMDAPRSKSGRYWKTEYDSYSSRTQTEMRKLLKKEQVAKKYAKHKDIALQELEDELRAERRKVTKLEQQVREYASQVERAGRGHESKRDIRRNSFSPGDKLASFQNRMASLERPSVTLKKSEPSHLDKHKRLSFTEDVGRPRGKTHHVPQSGEGTPRRTPSRRRSSSKATPQDLQSSDLWANAATENEAGRKRHSRSSKDADERRPLVQRQVNLPVPEAADDTKAALTEERREAALKRLENKKRSRERNKDTL